MDAPLMEFNLQPEIELLRNDETYRRGRVSKVLARFPDFRVVLIVMKSGNHMEEHSVKPRISIQTVSGHIQLHVGEELLDLPAGRVLVLDRDIPHDVLALEDSAFLLTFGAA